MGDVYRVAFDVEVEDPGVSPAGCSIEQSSSEVLDCGGF